jgi:hypothetical protein
MSPQPAAKRAAKQTPTVVSIITETRVRCRGCRRMMKSGGFSATVQNRPVCLQCGGLLGLVFLRRGNITLTKRACKLSARWVVVVKWSRARRRKERRGVLVEPQALEQARRQSAADEVQRQKRRARAATRRERQDQQYISGFATAIRARFPACPPGIEGPIAEHACAKYSGRVGRTAAAKSFDAEMIHRAVVAHVRHANTRYDRLIASGVSRHEARELVRTLVDETLSRWRGESEASPLSLT